MKILKRLLIVLLVIGAGLWINNTSLFTKPDGNTRLIAHRGLHHVYAGNDRSNDTCRAQEVEPITHPFIENTVPSIRAAFDHGADVVEIDVHLTSDDVFAVYHDWQLECQTNGEGVTHKQTFEYLRQLDLAYNISADGTTFPLRGQGVGMVPDLSELLTMDLSGPLFINFKSNRQKEGTALGALLSDPEKRANVFGAYGGGPPTRTALSALPSLKGFDRQSIIACAKPYMFLGWSGYVPSQCRNTIMVLPINYAPFIWGWPHKFVRRMRDAGTDIIVLGPFDGSGFTTGIDDAAMLERVPENIDAYIWTNKIEQIGPLVKQ